MVSIQTYTPRQLSPYIKSFWRLQVPAGLSYAYAEEILPDGHHEIIFHLTAAPGRKRQGCNNWCADPAVFFSGQNKKSYSLQLQPGALMYGVRFHPHTQALLYPFPAHLSTDTLIPFEAIAGTDRLSACVDECAQTTFERLELAFSKKIAGLPRPADAFAYVEAAVRRILQQKGNATMATLEKLTGVTSRHIEKSFQHYVGVSPKQFCHIIKYNQFINFRKAHPHKSLTECAYENLFSDQSHLIRLSQLITGQSPKAYFGKPHFINDFFLHP